MDSASPHPRKIKVLLLTRQFNSSPKVEYLKYDDNFAQVFSHWQEAEIAASNWVQEHYQEYVELNYTVVEV